MGGFFWKEQCFGKGYLEAEGDSYCCWSVLMSQPLLCRIGCIQEVTWLRSNAERGLSSWRQEIFVGQSLKNIRFSKNVHGPGIEPGPPAWQARILPLNHQCCYTDVKLRHHELKCFPPLDESLRETILNVRSRQDLNLRGQSPIDF